MPGGRGERKTRRRTDVGPSPTSSSGSWHGDRSQRSSIPRRTELDGYGTSLGTMSTDDMYVQCRLGAVSASSYARGEALVPNSASSMTRPAGRAGLRGVRARLGPVFSSERRPTVFARCSSPSAGRRTNHRSSASGFWFAAPGTGAHETFPFWGRRSSSDAGSRSNASSRIAAPRKAASRSRWS